MKLMHPNAMCTAAAVVDTSMLLQAYRNARCMVARARAVLGGHRLLLSFSAALALALACS